MLQEQTEAEGYRDIDSARSMLDQLMSQPASSKTEVSLSPTAQSVRRTSRRPIRQETDRGSARGMAMELEEVTKTQGPRTKRQTEEFRQKMELLRDTLGMPTLTRAGLGRAGDLMAKRFNEGGEAKKSRPTGEFGMFGGLKQMLLESDRFKKLTPLQVRTYLESVEGFPEMRTMPITEKNLDEEELAKLLDVVEVAKKTRGVPPGTVDYDVHELQRRKTMGATPIADTDFSVFPSANLRNTLGQFVYEEQPDGTLVVRDRYDYTKDVAERFNPLIKYANKMGVNRPVEIRIPAASGKVRKNGKD